MVSHLVLLIWLFLQVNGSLKTTCYPNLFLMAVIDSILVWKITYSVISICCEFFLMYFFLKIVTGIDSPIKLESLTDIIQKKIEETNGEFLIGQHEEPSPPPWAALFDGNHQVVIQKEILSPASRQLPDGKRKKRRAPLPPPDKAPFSLKTQSNTDLLVKENGGKTFVSQTSSLDTKSSTLVHHLQKPMAAPRKLLPAWKNSLTDGENADTRSSFEAKPVPTSRQKSIKDILDPRSWLQAQV